MPPTLFLDANIFFAAARSPTGGSGLILKLAEKKKIKIITIRLALFEAEKNIENKLGSKYLSRHYKNLSRIEIKVQSLGVIEETWVQKLKEVLPLKDIPILLGALLSGADFLITLDKAHFLGNQKLKNLKLPLKIVNPGDFLKEYLKSVS